MARTLPFILLRMAVTSAWRSRPDDGLGAYRVGHRRPGDDDWHRLLGRVAVSPSVMYFLQYTLYIVKQYIAVLVELLEGSKCRRIVRKLPMPAAK